MLLKSSVSVFLILVLLPFSHTLSFSAITIASQECSENYPGMFESARKAIQNYPVNLYDYLQEKVYAITALIEDLKNPLNDSDDADCLILADLIGNYKHENVSSTLIFYFSLVVSWVNVTYAGIVNNSIFQELQNNGYCMVVLDGLH